MDLGANRPQDMVFPLAPWDENARSLDGANDMCCLSTGENTSGHGAMVADNVQLFLLVANPLNCYHLNSRSKFTHNLGGWLDIYLQKDPPGHDKEANWLSGPSQDAFSLMLGLQWPKETFLQGDRSYLF